MDNSQEKEYGYKRTMREARDASDEKELDRARRFDDEIAYETLAVNASMGMFGMEEQVANLMQLELAQEILFKLSEDEHSDEESITD